MHKLVLTIIVSLALLDAAKAAGPAAMLAAGRTVILPSPNAQVCFYTEPRFAGQKWCVRSGDRAASMPKGWDNAISAIRISGAGAAYVCRRPGFRGGCTIFAKDWPRLLEFDDAISSFVVLPGWGGDGTMPR